MGKFNYPVLKLWADCRIGRAYVTLAASTAYLAPALEFPSELLAFPLNSTGRGELLTHPTLPGLFSPKKLHAFNMIGVSVFSGFFKSSNLPLSFHRPQKISTPKNAQLNPLHFADIPSPTYDKNPDSIMGKGAKT